MNNFVTVNAETKLSNFALTELRLGFETKEQGQAKKKEDVRPPSYEQCMQAQQDKAEEYSAGVRDRMEQIGYAVEGFLLSTLQGQVVQGNTMAAKLRVLRKAAQDKAKVKAQVKVPTLVQIEEAMDLALDNDMTQDAEFCMWLAEGVSCNS